MPRKDILDTEDIAVHTRAVLQLGEKIKEHDAAGVMLAVEIGQHVIEVRGKLDDRLFERWVKKRLGFKNTRWADELMNLALVHAQNPEWVAGIARLGRTKVLRAARASVPFRWTLTADWADDRGRKAIDMTTQELDHVLDKADPGAEKRAVSARTRKLPTPMSIDEVISFAEAYWQQSNDPVQWRRLADWLMPRLGAVAAPAITPAAGTAPVFRHIVRGTPVPTK